MSDLISRQAAIDEIARWIGYLDKDMISRIQIGLERLPSAQPTERCIATITLTDEQVREAFEEAKRKILAEQPEHRWIPCSERLPEDYKDVLVYFEYYRYGDYNCMFSTYGIGSYSGEYDFWLVNSETGWRKLHVFAWMPLPEPYGGEQE